MCLEDDQLETATSCLIVLQSMESAMASVQVKMDHFKCVSTFFSLQQHYLKKR